MTYQIVQYRNCVGFLTNLNRHPLPLREQNILDSTKMGALYRKNIFSAQKPPGL